MALLKAIGFPQNARLTALTKDQGENSVQKKTVVKPRRGGKGGGWSSFYL